MVAHEEPRLTEVSERVRTILLRKIPEPPGLRLAQPHAGHLLELGVSLAMLPMRGTRSLKATIVHLCRSCVMTPRR